MVLSTTMAPVMGIPVTLEGFGHRISRSESPRDFRTMDVAILVMAKRVGRRISSPRDRSPTNASSITNRASRTSNPEVSCRCPINYLQSWHYPSEEENTTIPSEERLFEERCKSRALSKKLSSASLKLPDDYFNSESLESSSLPNISYPFRSEIPCCDAERGFTSTSTFPTCWDVLGLGQAMVDLSASVEDEDLNRLGLIKGTRKVVNHEETTEVQGALDVLEVAAGGSLSNTLVALARLGEGLVGRPPLTVAMTGSVGSDCYGGFYRGQLQEANVHFLSESILDATTGMVIVCTTPDAQRTMLSYQGMSARINFDDALEEQISKSRVFIVEGYLWELSETVEAIEIACTRAKDQGITVALTASDVSCVNRHRQKMWDVMVQSTDILFANAEEARALLEASCDMTTFEAARRLSLYCPLVSVTDGADGSYLGVKGVVTFIEPAECVPVDSCGAGDAYAAGVLYAILDMPGEWSVAELQICGTFAARVAAAVVGQQGPRLKKSDANNLAMSMICLKMEPIIATNTEVLQI